MRNTLGSLSPFATLISERSLARPCLPPPIPLHGLLDRLLGLFHLLVGLFGVEPFRLDAAEDLSRC